MSLCCIVGLGVVDVECDGRRDIGVGALLYPVHWHVDFCEDFHRPDCARKGMQICVRSLTNESACGWACGALSTILSDKRLRAEGMHILVMSLTRVVVGGRVRRAWSTTVADEAVCGRHADLVTV